VGHSGAEVRTKMCTIRDIPLIVRFLLISVLVCSAGPSLYGQEIHIRVLDARNGKSITNECLNVWFGHDSHGVSLLAPTNNVGVVVLHFADNTVTAGSVPGAACEKGLAINSMPVPDGADAIVVTGGYYVVCQEYGEVRSGDRLERLIPPSYPIRRILESGVSATNTCGKFRAQAKPGELIFFVRPPTFWERMRE
jgi:hypothetical protein